MGNIDIFLIAIGLAMDAFAVSIAAAASGHVKSKRAVFRLSFHFGLFQFLMPVLGWFSGYQVAEILFMVDHWIAFGLLVFVGYHMIHSAYNPEQIYGNNDPSSGVNLILLSVATSIDALAVGFSLAMLDISIWYPSVIIGFITSGLSLLGLRLGKFISEKMRSIVTILGGVVIILIGVNILVEHL